MNKAKKQLKNKIISSKAKTIKTMQMTINLIFF